MKHLGSSSSCGQHQRPPLAPRALACARGQRLSWLPAHTPTATARFRRLACNADDTGACREGEHENEEGASALSMGYNPAPPFDVNDFDSECFQVLDTAEIDSASAGYFFTQLALHDLHDSPLSVDELLHATRIADISGFALPPAVTVQLQRQVSGSDPTAAAATADALLAAYDLPDMLGVLHGLEVTPSVAWTDYALRAWLAGRRARGATAAATSSCNSSGGGGGGGGGGSGGGSGGSGSALPLNVGDVRAVMGVLEMMYIPEAEPWREPPPPSSTPSSPQRQQQQEQHQQHHGQQAQQQGDMGSAWRGSAGQPSSSSPSASSPSASSQLASTVRGWLDACVNKLMSTGGLARPHQREDFYCMLPHLATCPSAATVERLYAEAWPPSPAPPTSALTPASSSAPPSAPSSASSPPPAASSGDGNAPSPPVSFSSTSSSYSSPEAIASLLWLFASSGAQMLPEALQRELRSLSQATIRLALATDGGSHLLASGTPRFPSPSFPGGPASTGASGSTSASVASLFASFSLPSAPGSASASAAATSSSASASTSADSAADPAADSAAYGPPSNPPFTFPASFASSSGSGAAAAASASAAVAAPRRLTSHSAYLILWAFHHHRYTPSHAGAKTAGPLLLGVVLGGARELAPRQRCRVLRSLLLCFRSAQAQMRAAHRGWAVLFGGWEMLGAGELLALLSDMATLARLRRQPDSSGGGGGGGGAVSGGVAATWDEAADVFDGSSWWTAEGAGDGAAAEPAAGGSAPDGAAGSSASATAGGGGEDAMSASFARFLRESGAAGSGSSGGGGSGGGAGSSSGSLQIQLSTLAAFVLQLPGWSERLAGMGLVDATDSLASLLTVLDSDTARFSTTASKAAAAAAAAGAGGGGAAARQRQLAPSLLADWLARVLPIIEVGVKQATDDWGSAARRVSGRGASSPAAGPRPPPGSTFYSNNSSSSSTAVNNYYSRGVEAARTPGAVAVASASAAAAAAAASGASMGVSGADGMQHWLSPSAAAPAAPPPPAPLTAGELTAALAALGDTASALEGRAHSSVHRSLMWAVQRLGSRAGRCALEAGSFSRVPEMLMRLDALGWVSVPIEWAEAVVRAPDGGAWFAKLGWREALRTVLASGRLVTRAQAEVLRRHGSQMVVSSSAAAITAGAVAEGVGGAEGATAAAPALAAPRSKAEALLAEAQRLRSHLLSLLTARASGGDGAAAAAELRQLALTWHAYGMPYDREALAALLDAAAAALAVAGGTAVAAPVHDAVLRLEMVCVAVQAPQEEVDALFGAFRQRRTG